MCCCIRRPCAVVARAVSRTRAGPGLQLPALEFILSSVGRRRSRVRLRRRRRGITSWRSCQEKGTWRQHRPCARQAATLNRLSCSCVVHPSPVEAGHSDGIDKLVDRLSLVFPPCFSFLLGPGSLFWSGPIPDSGRTDQGKTCRQPQGKRVWVTRGIPSCCEPNPTCGPSRPSRATVR